MCPASSCLACHYWSRRARSSRLGLGDRLLNSSRRHCCAPTAPATGQCLCRQLAAGQSARFVNFSPSIPSSLVDHLHVLHVGSFDHRATTLIRKSRNGASSRPLKEIASGSSCVHLQSPLRVPTPFSVRAYALASCGDWRMAVAVRWRH